MEKIVLVRAEKIQMSAILWSRGPILFSRERVFLAARAALLSVRVSEHFGFPTAVTVPHSSWESSCVVH